MRAIDLDRLPPSLDRERVAALVAAIRASWSADTAVEPDRWSPERPSIGHCEVSSLRFWDEFGGDMVEAEVFVDGERAEYHWWNRVDGVDIDLTVEQFHGHEDIRVARVAPHDQIARRRHEVRADVLERAARFDTVVAGHLGDVAP